MKALQKFDVSYLEECRSMKPDQIVRFLEDFRILHGQGRIAGKSQLISMKVPHPLLQTFKTKCKMLDTPYQTQIKKLMVAWLKGD